MCKMSLSPPRDRVKLFLKPSYPLTLNMHDICFTRYFTIFKKLFVPKSGSDSSTRNTVPHIYDIWGPLKQITLDKTFPGINGIWHAEAFYCNCIRILSKRLWQKERLFIINNFFCHNAFNCLPYLYYFNVRAFQKKKTRMEDC